MRIPRIFGGILLALAATVTVLSETAAPIAQAPSVPQILAVLDGGQVVIGSVDKPAGITVTGAVSARPPAEPFTSLQGREPDDHAPLPGPVDRIMRSALADPGPGPSPVAATDMHAPQAASDLLLKRDSILSGAPSGYTSSVAEPSVGGSGDAIFQTYNWYAARSADNGTTWGYVSPYSMFPTTGSFSGGFCCDQRVTQVTSRNLVIWSLQYLENGTTNGIRIAVAHGAAGLAANSWQYHDFTPGDFGAAYATGYWLDYPSLSVSSNYLYFTYNMYTTAANTWTASVVGRVPLDALDSNMAFTLTTYVTTSLFNFTPVSGATSRMFFASDYSSTTVAVLDWPESTTTPTVRYASGLNSTYFGTQTCTALDGTNPCGRADTRIQAGWLNSTELGFAWSSAQNSGAGRPYPFTRVIILDPASPATLLSQPDIWSANYAYLYPALAVNGRGHVGGVIDVLGGSQGSGVASTMLALVRDDYSAGAWATISVATSDAGTASAWGDYNASIAHASYPNTWLIGGKIQSGGTANANSRVHSTWLMRTRDDALFTDDPLQAGVTPIKAVHITELRSRIDTLRVRYGLAAYSWTNATLVPGSTTIQAAHINELRLGLQEAYIAAGLPAPTYTVPAVTANSTTTLATIITELRAWVSAIW